MVAVNMGAAIHAVCAGALRDNPGRFGLTLTGVVLGVALAVAVHVINASALNEFKLAVHSLSGQADLLIESARAGYDESLYPTIARLAQVQAASPAIESEVQLAGRGVSLKFIGMDPFRAAQVQPQWFAAMESSLIGLFDPDALLLSHAAAQWLGVQAGDTLAIKVGTSSVELKVIGLLPAAATRQRLALMDIASLQWRLQRLGQIDRIDLRLRPGTDVEGFRRSLAPLLPAGVAATTPDAQMERITELSRSYRLNLDMLALVALITGALLVYSTQVLSILRRRSQLALLRVLGLTRSALCAMLIAEGALVGILGSTLGVALGCAMAAGVLGYFGGDLGAGYFRSLSPELNIAPAALVAYWLLGLAFAILGAAIPAIEAGRRAPALALRSGDEEEVLPRPTSAGVVLVLLGLILSLAPPLYGLPIFGYTAIALILLGALFVMPRLSMVVLRRLPAWRMPAAMLARAQLQATPRQVAIATGAIVASFSLMVAMLIMVGSFRQSLDQWLTRVLPADIYVRTAAGGDSGFFTEKDQTTIATLPGVARAQFVRSRNLLLSPDRPAVTVLARMIDITSAAEILPLVSAAFAPHANAPPPAWISEVAADLHGLRVGDEIRLPLDGQAKVFIVMGIWRDYARQSGAIVINRDDYIHFTGDRLANEAALWVAPQGSLGQIAAVLRERLDAPQTIQITTPQEIQLVSMSIFDRSFALTYALEIVAVLIGLFGVSVSFRAQVLARRREFGVLRHLGMTRREIGAMLVCEGALVSALGAGFGLALGWLLSLILVYVINRQSFHWSIDMHIPWLALAALAGLLVAAASITAAWSGRRAMSGDVVSAVREDW